MAQTTAGRLSGVVSGPDGVLPGATVTVTDNKTGKELTVVTGGEGNFLFPQLEFGAYTVKITASGFKTYVANEVKIDVGREYNLTPTLEVGSVQETVTVTAGADVVTNNTAQVSNTVSPQQILSLPLLTRNPLSLTNLQAGVASNSAQNTTINGMRTTFTNITRDGINIQDTFIRSNATDFAPGRPSVDDTGEFTIATSNQEADQGYGGAQIRLVTPRGTKDFHGALFAYNRNSAFAANSFFNNRQGLKRPFRNRNQYGGKVSGPLPIPRFGEGGAGFYKGKGVFFFAYEGIKDPVTASATRTILTPFARSGGFSYTRATAGAAVNTTVGGATVVCPATTANNTGTCQISNFLAFARAVATNGAAIPSTISPIIASRVISQLPETSNFTGGDGLNTAGYRLLRGSDQTRDQYASRIDVDFNEKSSITGVYNYNNESNLRPDADTTKFTVTPAVTQLSVNKQLTVAYRRTFESNFVNEVRGGMFTSEVPFDRTDELPAYLIGGLPVTNPENTFLAQGRNTKAFNLQDNADYVMGNHTFRFGAQSQVFKVNSYNDAGLVPTITLGSGTGNPALTTGNFTPYGGIASVTSANSFLNFFGGIYSTAAQSFNVNDLSKGYEASRPVTPFRYENHSLYFADRWLATKGLTLSLGVRYEVFPALRLNNGLALEPFIENPDDPIPSLVNPNGKTVVIGTNAGRKNAYYKTDWNNFAPNLGVAWTPSFETGIGKFMFGESGKSVIRGGYSHVYGNDSIVTSINNAAVGNPGLARTTFTISNITGRLDNGITTVTPGAFAQPPRSYLLNNAQNTFFGTVFGIDPKLQTPKVQQYNIGFQREFFGNTALEIRYVGSRSDNLARGVDLNQIDIFNNGFLADFNRAASNLSINTTERNNRIATCVAGGGTTTACTTTVNGQLPLSAAFNSALPGSVQLSLFPLLGALSGSGGGIGTAPGTGQAAINSTIAALIQNGTPADLALTYINSTANLNNQPSSLNPTASPIIKFLRNPAAGAVDYFLNDAYYRYDSLQIEIRRRFSQGLYFQANYTFSKNLTNAVGTSQNLFEPYLDNNNKEQDKQRADFDQTHVFNFNGIYQLPFGKGKMFLNSGGLMDKVFGGWEVSGLAQWSSGAPISFTDTRGTLNRNGRSSRQTPNSTLTNDEIRALTGIFEANGRIYWIDPSVVNSQGAATNGYGTTAFPGQVFFNTKPGQTGNIGRMLIDGPKYFNINAALLKSIRFGENIRIQLRAEAFNLLNNVNFVQNTQFADIGSTSFGQITSAFGPREFQFAARFEF
jgi:hypothetical protein